MYIRVLVLAFVFNQAIGILLTIPPLLFGVAFLISKIVLKRKDTKGNVEDQIVEDEVINKNPLELKTSIIFGGLFVLFALITENVLQHYGNSGVSGLAFIIGIFDVDPFIIYLLEQDSTINQMIIALAVINATNSNNLMKMTYAVFLSSKESRKPILLSFLALVISGLIGCLGFLFDLPLVDKLFLLSF